MCYVHSPVLVDEVLNELVPKSAELFLDCTIGEGGHSEAVLNKFSNISVYGLDRDRDILSVAESRLFRFGARFKGILSNFTDNFLEKNNLQNLKFDAALIDLGISVYHYKRSGKGFSFGNDEELSMRLDSDSISASYIVNNYSETQLVEIFFRYGEERFSRKIAANIIRARKCRNIERSSELAEIVSASIPERFKSRKIHPATKVFQAIRIEANNELDNIREGIPNVLASLKKGGRLGVITFHSLEDRIVKKIFKELEKACICPPGLPVCVCGKIREVKTSKLIIPSGEEISINPPSRSAKLRIAEKLI